jgi:hypothetical protein
MEEIVKALEIEMLRLVRKLQDKSATKQDAINLAVLTECLEKINKFIK